MLNVIKGTDPINIRNISMLITGQPKAGKTTLGYASDKPLVIGFDDGITRPTNRREGKESVIVSSWKDIAQITEADVKEFNTIIIDTVGSALSFLGEHLMQINPKVCKMTNSYTLSMKGYGEMKREFVMWFKRFKYQYHKDIIFLAHQKTSLRNDMEVISPDIPGASQAEIERMCDFLGYIYVENSHRYINFNTSDVFLGGNPHLAFTTDPILVPDCSVDFTADWIANAKMIMNEANNKTQELEKKFKNEFGIIADLKSVNDLNTFYGDLKKKELSKSEKSVIWAKVEKKAKDLDIVYRKAEDDFFKAVPLKGKDATDEEALL